MAIKILAHRANLAGPCPQRENSLEACREAMAEGFGLEIDLRRADETRFYISHDPAPLSKENALESFRPLFQEWPHLVIAVNVKELGYEGELIRLQREGTFGTEDFYFDFELLERETPGRTQNLIDTMMGDSPVRLASRLSDRNEPLSQCLSIPSAIVWADEFDSLWLTEQDFRSIGDSGRKVFAISPELHGFTPEQRIERWAQFKAWKIDGLCTDYPLEAREFFAV